MSMTNIAASSDTHLRYGTEEVLRIVKAEERRTEKSHESRYP